MSEPNYELLYQGMAPLFDQKWLKDCAFANEFRNEWRRVLRASARNNQSYFPKNQDAVFSCSHTFEGVTLPLHFDQLKLADWFQRDSKGKQRRVFFSRVLTRSRFDGTIGYHSSPLLYDKDRQEPAIPDGKQVFVCSLPGFPPPLQTIYGHQRVENGFYGLVGKNKLDVFLVAPEFLPAFLCNSFELCAYLFWMDCCIMMENRVKLRDKDLQGLLHIFRPDSMLTLKGLA